MQRLGKWLRWLLAVIAALALAAYALSFGALKLGWFLPEGPYDATPPALSPLSRPAVLVFYKTNGFVHEEAIPAANALFEELARAEGWDVVVTDNGAVHGAKTLSSFDLVIWNNVSGDVLNEAQRSAFRAWIEGGGGFIGVHGAGGDPAYRWRWYVEDLVGADFVGHTYDPQFQTAELRPEPGITMTAHLPTPWRIEKEEWYAFAENPRERGFEILLTIDKASYSPGGSVLGLWTARMPGEHPLAWRHRPGQGRAVYSAIGHRAGTYALAEYREFLRRAMLWALDTEEE